MIYDASGQRLVRKIGYFHRQLQPDRDPAHSGSLVDAVSSYSVWSAPEEQQDEVKPEVEGTK